MNTETITHTTTYELAELNNIIGAVALHASNDKNRLPLRTIRVEQTAITATDSYTLATFTPTKPITTGEPIHIDAKELATALTQATKQNKTGTATITSDGHTWQLTAGNNTTQGQCINIEYPNYRQLLNQIAATTPFEPTGYNPEYLTRIAKTSSKLNKTAVLKMNTWSAPTKPILFETNTEHGQLTQLIMPTRITD